MSEFANKVILKGIVKETPTIEFLSSGAKIASILMATDDIWKEKSTGWHMTNWHKIHVFNEKLVDLVERFVKCGSKVHIEGKIHSNNYPDKKGIESFTSGIVLTALKGNLGNLDKDLEKE